MGRLLLIGHDPALAGALGASHHLAGHEVETCGGPFEATRLLSRRLRRRRHGPHDASATDDLALLAASCSRVRPGIRAIVLAPTLSTADVIAALRQQVYACFTRPVDYEEVADMARAAIDDPDWRERDRGHVGPALLDHAARVVPAHHRRPAHPLHDRVQRRHLPSERDLLMTAFREMLLNAMEHGAGFDPEKVIEVTAAQTARAIVFHFRDPGDGFDREDLSHAAATSQPEDVIDDRHASAPRAACARAASAC